MSEPPLSDPSQRFQPRAGRAMAHMFDDVSPRYDLLNWLMTAGQDGAWRAAMWRAVPETARAVLDLCTGSGVSLAGLLRPGRLVLGMDVSLGMLERAAAEHAGGWAPRLACADAFRLPLRDGALDAVTIAFGMRNLRPRAQVLGELHRVLRPGGVLVVLEATAPAPGARGALHAFHLRRVVPLLGRLSDDPSAYQYLSASIFEFGSGREFESALSGSGFEIVGTRRFLLGATRLWVARRPGPGPAVGVPPGRLRVGSGEFPTGRGPALQDALPEVAAGREPGPSAAPWDREWRGWTASQTVFSGVLTVALAWGTLEFAKLNAGLPLEPWQRRGLWLLLVGGLTGFLIRTLVLTLRLLGPPRRR